VGVIATDIELSRQLSFYSGQPEPHQSAVDREWFEVSLLVELGLAIHHNIRKSIEDLWGRFPVEGPQEQKVSKLDQAVARWVEGSLRTLERVKALEGAGRPMAAAEELRAVVLDVRTGVPLFRAVAQASRIAREGYAHGTTTEDLRRELQNRMGS
jgi:hypothetical protein